MKEKKIIEELLKALGFKPISDEEREDRLTELDLYSDK